MVTKEQQHKCFSKHLGNFKRPLHSFLNLANILGRKQSAVQYLKEASPKETDVYCGTWEKDSQC